MPTALVSGASRGVGKGVATALHDAGYTVFATGRTIESADLPAAESSAFAATTRTTRRQTQRSHGSPTPQRRSTSS